MRGVTPAAIVLLSSLLAQPGAAGPDAGAPAMNASSSEEGDVFSVNLARTPARVNGGVRRFIPAGPARGTLTVQLRGGSLARPGKFGELLFDLRRTPVSGVSWNNRSLVQAWLRVSPAFVGDGERNWQRAHRARLFVVDARGRRLYLPHAPIVDRPPSTDGWLELRGQVTVDVPIPLGLRDKNFAPTRITALGLNVEAFNREDEKVAGTIELRDLQVTFGRAVAARVLPPNPAVLAKGAERSAGMQARIYQRCGLRPPQVAVGVNLAWPSVRTQEGEESATIQLYGRLLDGGTPWYGRLWDVGEEAVAIAVRNDFREIRETFGAGAVVRLWLFADLRSGLALDGEGDPSAVTERARGNMHGLLRLAAEEQVVLIPVLLDFHMADRVVRTGPDGAWPVSERPDVITDPRRRAKLVKAMEDFVGDFAGNAAILAWDVMNEPENAAAVVTPEHFADLQTFIYELVEAVHRAGDVATVGHRSAGDPALYFRGRVATDLGQAHYYPLVDTRPNPTPFQTPLTSAFGHLPAGWGELQARPGQIATQLAGAQRAGHRLLLFWSWRGHEPTADGYAVKPYSAEIRQALMQLGR
jgi:hypothetical protein